jgi:hypothetical protein
MTVRVQGFRFVNAFFGTVDALLTVPFCTRHLEHSKPFIYRRSRHGSNVNLYAPPFCASSIRSGKSVIA